uniref:Methyltransferase domain-containing protein n=1 Tax=Odontella aurita TaxID=265563 RepID=A0A7S4I4B1_9STRA|mmetsp:Transcript_19758/g.57352  ORF Transcript_19758/g.57352 Transcript_19758/m.57352 type:complete len:315 (+) Transcript_19758:185-1129(+)
MFSDFGRLLVLLLPVAYQFGADGFTTPLAGQSRTFNTRGNWASRGSIPNAIRPAFHTVLEQIGKTVLRPGGSEATEKMHSWADLREGDSVIELSAGLGRGGMDLAELYGCQVLLTDTDHVRLDKAEKTAERRGLSKLVRTQEMNMLDVSGTRFQTRERGDSVPQFDVALIEAALLFQPRKNKASILNSLAGVSSRILIHDMCLRNVREDSDDVSRVKREMGPALGVNFRPETESQWKALLESSGWKVEHTDVGSLRVVDPKSILRDEGLRGSLRIIWNLITKKNLRSRLLSTRNVIHTHHNHLGYIIMSAVSKT